MLLFESTMHFILILSFIKEFVAGLYDDFSHVRQWLLGNVYRYAR